MTEKGWGVDIRSAPVEADPRFRKNQVDWGAFSKRQMVPR